MLFRSAAGEQLDDLVVGEGNDEHRHRRGERQVKPEMRVTAERKETELGAVGGGREAVRTQSDPGEECDQRDVAARLRIHRITRRTEEKITDAAKRISGHGECYGKLFWGCSKRQFSCGSSRALD